MLTTIVHPIDPWGYIPAYSEVGLVLRMIINHAYTHLKCVKKWDDVFCDWCNAAQILNKLDSIGILLQVENSVAVRTELHVHTCAEVNAWIAYTRVSCTQDTR